MNKISMQRLTTPPKIALDSLQANNEENHHLDSTIINRLIFEDSSPDSKRKSIGKVSKLLPEPSRTSQQNRYVSPRRLALGKSPSGEMKVKSIKSLQVMREGCVNMDSKVRLEQKFEKALQKLTELKSHYEQRKTEKYDILNHKTADFEKKGKVDKVSS